MTQPCDALYRCPDSLSKDPYDVIIIGGGIYGVMLSLESARRGLRSLLLEQEDFGSQTSANHLRILHGGLRYLQSLDFKRFRDSVSERSWFLKYFPELTRTIDCLMPLSGKGLFRPSVFSAALAIDYLLALDQNRQLPQKNRIRFGQTLSRENAKDTFPYINTDTVGAALWQDGFIEDPPRLLIELLRWACFYGSKALNYCGVDDLLVSDGRVAGVIACDKSSNTTVSFHAPQVINAAGPWCRELAAAWDRDLPFLFSNRILVWNLLIDCPSLSSAAVAVSAPGNNHIYFAVPWQGKSLIGTGHQLLNPGEHREPDAEDLMGMIKDLNAAIPGINLSADAILKVYWGVMPGDTDCRLGKRPVIYDHGAQDGPKGLTTISGVKFTTARSVADHTLTQLFPQQAVKSYGSEFQRPQGSANRWENLTCEDFAGWQQLFREEAVTHIEDALLRRSERFSGLELNEEQLATLQGYLP